jgi:mRNA interferase HigB
MRVIAKSTIKIFWENPIYSDSQAALESWYEEVLKADCSSPQMLKDQYRNASICAVSGVPSFAWNMSSKR